MKKYLLLGLLTFAAGLATAGAQTQQTQTTQTFTAPTNGQRGEHAQRQGQQPLPRRGEIGAFPRVRHNPLQLLNPFAPARYYGPPQDTVTVASDPAHGDPYTHSQVTGLILYGIAW